MSKESIVPINPLKSIFEVMKDSNGEREDKKLTILGDTISKGQDSVHELSKNVVEVVSKSAERASDITKETISKVQDNSHELNQSALKIVSESAERTSDVLEKSYEKHNLALAEKDKKIEEYQKSLQAVSEKVVELRVKEDIRNKYMQGVQEYATLQANYEEELSNVENQIYVMERKMAPLEKELQEIETNLKIEDRILDKANFEFEKSIEELENIKLEYKDSMIEEKYFEHLNRSKRKVKRILDEIFHHEYSLLNIEKDRLNKITEIAPLKEELEKLKIHFNLLSNSKKKFERVGVLSMLSPKSKEEVSDNRGQHLEVIDVIAE
jgi:DNA repair exonuclease SbcCD ATPase subunit